MAVRSRILNSTIPFTTGPQKELRGHLEGHSSLGMEMGSQGARGKEDLLPDEIPPLLKKVLTRGTAEDMRSRPQGLEKHCSFIAQAECDVLQEFSPSCSERPYIGSPNCLIRRASVEHNNVACGVAHEESVVGSRPLCSARKRRERQRRQRRRKEGDGEGEGKRERQRAHSGVPEQESSSQEVVPDYTSRSSSLGVQETERPGWDWTETFQPCYPQQAMLPHSHAPSCTTHPWCTPGPNALPKMSLCSQESTSEPHLSSQGNWSLARYGLRGNVCQEDQLYAPPFFKEVERETRAQEEGWVGDSDINEGLLFHQKLQPKDYEYMEGRDYSMLHRIQNGSYGEVYSVQDNGTGFKCAAKKILLSRFNSEEVGSWSALNSPRVVELYGAVREGPCVVLFMALKSGSVGQLLRERGRLPVDLALHYHCQVLEALEHLQSRRVLHLDIKADNVLLSEDGRDTFLCDFGHSERLDLKEWSTKANPEEGFRGTETHMAPEVVKGEPCGAKADVWSSCCMLLHMLNGCHPWTRYYSRPLCLKIANEDPPLREIPSNCKPHTADVIKAGLRKDPIKRASATELKEKTTRALKEVGGLTSPVKGAYQEPAKAEPMETHYVCSGPLAPPSPAPAPATDGSSELCVQWRSSWREHAEEEEEEKKGGDANRLSSSPGPAPSLRAHCSRQQKGECPSVSPLAWELEKEFYLSSLSQAHSPELQERLLSCLSSDCHLQRDLQDKDSGHWSVSYSGDLSSGVFSYGSQPDGHSFGMDWLGPAHLPPPRCLEGVDVCIQDFGGQCLRIRETPGVKVGYIAVGISNQISGAFSLETLDGRPVGPEEVVLDSGLWLRCTRSPTVAATGGGGSGTARWRHGSDPVSPSARPPVTSHPPPPPLLLPLIIQSHHWKIHRKNWKMIPDPEEKAV
ncbi:hypothetical protein AAFF_G00340650 [Aldrovandia affinis]|uniref:Protein kinase domain-containing protein n=1 Tax=Aldrovandia affinis TaxID=143900 RepID=A0AAD7WPA2_9TELE|nr:hypothetical protein AAFF_G00340650 [Aldrovandia affinis]